MVDFAVYNWTSILVAVLLAACFFLNFKDFLLSTRQAVKSWLLWAVADVEMKIGPELGRLKLARVYDMFVVRFPWTSKLLAFRHFEQMVANALYELEELGIEVVMTKFGKEFRKV